MSGHVEGTAAVDSVTALAGRLRDLHLPEPIGWWPPAPGWWALGAATLALGAVALALGLRAISATRHRVSPARVALQACHDEWRATRDTARYYLHGTRVLRRVAIGIDGRAHVARLHGGCWVDWLERRGAAPFSEEVREVLADGVYRRHPPERVDAVHRELLRWLDERDDTRAAVRGRAARGA